MIITVLLILVSNMILGYLYIKYREKIHKFVEQISYDWFHILDLPEEINIIKQLANSGHDRSMAIVRDDVCILMNKYYHEVTKELTLNDIRYKADKEELDAKLKLITENVDFLREQVVLFRVPSRKQS